MAIQWFPGHMNLTKQAIQDRIKDIDVVIEMLDAALVVAGGGIYVGTPTIIPIPEPAICRLLMGGVLLLGGRFRRRGALS